MQANGGSSGQRRGAGGQVQDVPATSWSQPSVAAEMATPSRFEGGTELDTDTMACWDVPENRPEDVARAGLDAI